jgi:hypothetical protein
MKRISIDRTACNIGREGVGRDSERFCVSVCLQRRRINIKHINTLCGQNVELLNVKMAVHIVTTGLQRVKYLL